MELTVEPLEGRDPGDGLAVLGRRTMEALELDSGDYVVLRGPDGDPAVAQVIPSDDADPGTIRTDELLRRTAHVEIEGTVTAEPVSVSSADSVTVALPEGFGAEEHVDLRLRDELVSRAVLAGQVVPVTLRARGGPDPVERTVPIRIAATDPGEAVVIRDWTRISVSPEPAEGLPATGDLPGSGATAVTFADVGGLDAEIEAVRETVELPLVAPDLFTRLGTTAPKGVLLYGPPGTGKTLLARALANETDIHFETVSGPAVVSKYPGETGERLRERFESAAANEPAIVFLDEVDAVAAERGEGREADSSAVGRLLSLMDGLVADSRVAVVGTTNRQDAIDPALRRPGRFDREIEIGVPDRDGREGILRIHARGMPLAEDVDVASLAERTHGFVGADLENLTREAVLHTLRRNDVRPDGAVDEAALSGTEVAAADFEAALRSTEPSALREVFVEVPDVTWADVGGLEGTIERLRETVQWPLEHPEAFDRVSLRPATGVLLSGPPGTGKTLLAKVVANEAQSNFISIKGPELLDKYVGESERGVREVFEKAQTNAPTVVFFDEIDAIAAERGSRGGDPGVGERVVSQLLTEMDGLEELEDVVVIATTNRPDLLDDALLRPGRFDRHIRVSAPDEAARREVFRVHTRDRPLADDVDLDALARRTGGYVGADIEAVCREAATLAVRDYVGDDGADIGTVHLTAEHFEAALETVDRDREDHGDGTVDGIDLPE
jgi:transitional endoplasmic reticulum ATPase